MEKQSGESITRNENLSEFISKMFSNCHKKELRNVNHKIRIENIKNEINYMLENPLAENELKEQSIEYLKLRDKEPSNKLDIIIQSLREVCVSLQNYPLDYRQSIIEAFHNIYLNELHFNFEEKNNVW